MCDRPVDEQVLLHSETLGSRIALGFVLGSSRFGQRFARFVLVALQLRELEHLLLLHAAVVPRLLPHSRRVDHQRVLETQLKKTFH